MEPQASERERSIIEGIKTNILHGLERHERYNRHLWDETYDWLWAIQTTIYNSTSLWAYHWSQTSLSNVYQIYECNWKGKEICIFVALWIVVYD